MHSLNIHSLSREKNSNFQYFLESIAKYGRGRAPGFLLIYVIGRYVLYAEIVGISKKGAAPRVPKDNGVKRRNVPSAIT